MFVTDKELIQFSLDCWANHIETGNINLSAQDAQNADLKPKALSLEQMKLVVRIRDLSNDVNKWVLK